MCGISRRKGIIYAFVTFLAAITWISLQQGLKNVETLHTNTKYKSWCTQLVEFHTNPPSSLCGNAAQNECACSVVSRSGSSLEKVGFDAANRPTFLSRSGVDWWLWFNHGRFFQAPSIYYDFSSPFGVSAEGSDTYFLEACLNWRGYCASRGDGLVNTWSTSLEVVPDEVTRDALFPRLARSVLLDSTEGGSGVVMTLDPNSKEWSKIATSIIFLTPNLVPDIIVTTYPCSRVDHYLTKVMHYRKLQDQFQFDGNGSSPPGSIYTRRGFELGIEREGYLPTPVFHRSKDPPGKQRHVSCGPLQQNKTRRPDIFEEHRGEAKLLKQDNEGVGYSCVIQDCSRHLLSSSYSLHDVDQYLGKSCLGKPKTYGHKRVVLHWIDYSRYLNATKSIYDYTYLVNYINLETGNSHPICTKKFDNGTSELGLLTPDLRCVPQVQICETARCATKMPRQRDYISDFKVNSVGVLSLGVQLSNGRFKSENVPGAVNYDTINTMVRTYLTGDDKKSLEAATGSTFSRLMTALQHSTPSELANFLSSKSFVVHPGNKHGVHLLRVLLAERHLDARRRALASYESDPFIRSFRRDGIVVVPMTWKKEGGLFLTAEQKNFTFRLFQYALGSQSKINDRFQLAALQVKNPSTDIRQQMHIDTFYSTTDVYVFTQKVTMSDGPLYYVNQSQRHSTEKLRLLQELVDRDEYAVCDSPRIYPPEQQKYDIRAVPLDVPGGSIVVVDTNGYHFWGRGPRVHYTATWEKNGRVMAPGGLPRMHPFEASI